MPTLIELVGEDSSRPVAEIDRVAHAILSLPSKLERHGNDDEEAEEEPLNRAG